MAAGPPGSRRLLPLLLLLGPALGPALGQGLGQTRFICTSVPLDGDVCAASALGTGSAEELKGTVLQLRETVLQQKETIMNQKETIRELTAKLGRCESQSVLELPGEGKGRKGFSKNTMGDLSRPAAAETLSQLGQTLQSLKTRLENLEVREESRGAAQPGTGRHGEPGHSRVPARGARSRAPGAGHQGSRATGHRTPGDPRSRARAAAGQGIGHRGARRAGLREPLPGGNSPLLCSPLAAVQQDELLQPDQQPEGHPAEQDR